MNQDLPDLTALTGVLTAAGWTVDSTTEMADGDVAYHLLGPAGRTVNAYADQAGGGVDLTLTDLTLDQAVGAVRGAGLAPAEVATNATTWLIVFAPASGINPITVPAGSASYVIADAIRRDLLDAAAIGVDDTITVTVDETANDVAVWLADDVIERGQITPVNGPAVTSDAAVDALAARLTAPRQPVDPDPRRAAYELVLAGVAAGLPIPDEARIPSNNTAFTVHLADNDPDSVDRWAAFLGLGEPTYSSAMRGPRRPFRAYEARGRSLPGLPGWAVDVASFCDVPDADAAELETQQAGNAR